VGPLPGERPRAAGVDGNRFSFATAAIGEAAAKIQSSRWGWAFREQPVEDFGD